jgi:hypothetical protein
MAPQQRYSVHLGIHCRGGDPIVLIASFIIPLGKLAALAYLLITVQRGWHRNKRDCMRLYRLLDITGMWSMLDVFRRNARTCAVMFSCCAVARRSEARVDHSSRRYTIV